MSIVVERVRPVAATPSASAAKLRKRRLHLSATGLIGVFIVAGAAFVGLAAPWIAPYDPAAADITARLKPPVWIEGGSAAHLLGTDQLGRDLLSRLMHGARSSLAATLAAIGLTAVIGGLAGLLAAHFGGWVDQLISRLVDVQLAFPTLLLAITIMAVAPPSLGAVILVLAITGWVMPCRLVRSRALSIRRREFVEAATACGATDARLIRSHLLPNVLPTLIVVVTLQSAHFVLAEAALSFLGLGLPPAIPSWGGIMNQGREYMEIAWWIETFPGLAIALLVSGLGLIGDWARDALDPRLRV